MSPLGSDGPLRPAVLRLLAAGPIAINDVVARLDDLGLLRELRDEGVSEADLGRAVLDEVVVTDEIWVAAGDKVLALSDQLTDAMVLTHRVSAEELAAGAVMATPDLVILDWNARDGLALADEDDHGHEGDDSHHGDGGPRLLRELGRMVPGQDLSRFVGPDGWLDAFNPGDLVSFTRTGRSVRIALAPTPEPAADDQREVDLLRGTIDHRIQPEGGEEAVALILDALTADPGAFRRPVRPLGELLESAGLERRGFSFGRTGEAWATSSETFRGNLQAKAAGRWGLGWCCQDALDQLVSALAAFDPASPPDASAAPALADLMAHDMVACALFDVDQVTGIDDHTQLVAFAEWVARTARSRAAGAHLVLGLCAEVRGDAAAAEEAFRVALRADPGYSPAAVELAQYEFDRGHLDRAVTLLRHPDLAEDTELLPFLESARRDLAATYKGVGRNDPCPCGSGRRFKTCCQRDPKPPTDAAHRMLQRKLSLFAGRDHRRSTLIGLASSACDPDDPDLVEHLRSALHQPLTTDIALFEGGVGEDYLAERGDLLPAAERQMLEILLDEPRRLWRVVTVGPGATLMVEEDDTGETMVVPAVAAEVPLRSGDIVLGRVARLPDDERRFFGIVLRVPADALASARTLIAAPHDADTLAAWWGQTARNLTAEQR